MPAGQVSPVELTTQGAGLLDDVQVVSGVDPRSLEYHWLSLRRSAREDPAGSEAVAVREGRVSVTPLQSERTNQRVLGSLQAADRMMPSGPPGNPREAKLRLLAQQISLITAGRSDMGRVEAGPVRQIAWKISPQIAGKMTVFGCDFPDYLR